MIELQLFGMISANFLILAFYVIYRPSKSKFTNLCNILIEISYICIEFIVLLYINDFEIETEQKLIYGKAMIAFSAIAIITVTIWMIWQFLKFMLDFKCIRDLIEQTKAVSKVHPGEDNLKIDYDREYGKDELISHISGLSASREENNEDRDEEDTVMGIEKQYDPVFNYDDDDHKNALRVPEPETNKNRGRKPRIETFSEEKS